jgi:hypothetical protein
MKHALWSLAAVVALAGVSYAADQTVIVPASPDKPIEVTEKDTVRITGLAISGSKLEVEVKGDAKLDKKTTVRKREGARDLIGVIEEEYEIKPTGKGKATVKVTATPPNGKPDVKTYEITIK